MPFAGTLLVSSCLGDHGAWLGTGQVSSVFGHAVLERVFDLIDLRRFAFFQQDFDDIESPWQAACAQFPEPGIRASLDQGDFFLINRIKRPDFGVSASGFDFDKQQQLAVSGNDINFAAPWAAEIGGEDSALLATQPGGGYFFAVFADPLRVASGAIGISQAARTIEPPAETSDDDGDKVRDGEELQGAPWCHIPDVSQSRIRGTRGQFRASCGRG